MLGKVALKKSNLTFSNLLRLDNLLYALLGYILAQAVVLGELKPFAPAVVGAVSLWDKQKRWWVLAGSALGFIISCDTISLCANLLILLTVFGALFNQYLVDKQQWITVPLLITAVVAVVKVIFFMFISFSLYDWVAILFESIFVGLIALVTISSLGAWEKKKQNLALSFEEIIGLVIIGIGILLGLENMYLLKINLQSFFSKTIVLGAAFLAGPGGGAAMGTIVGLVPSIGGNTSIATISFYALSGLLGGIFKGLGKVGIIIGFLLGNLLLSIYFSNSGDIIITLVETFLAGLVFFFFPFHFFKSLKEDDLVIEENSQEQSLQKLEKLSLVFKELSKAFVWQGNTDAKKRKEENPFLDILENISHQVCSNCTFYKNCWENEFINTYQGLLNVCNNLETKERLLEKDFPVELQRRCMRLRELTLALEYQMLLFKQEELYREKLYNSQQIVSNQLQGVAQLVKGFSRELALKEATDDELAAQIKEQLIDDNIKVQNVKVIETSDEDREIIIVQEACPNQNWCTQFVAPKVSQILDRTYTVKQSRCPTAGNSSCTYHLNPTKAYAVTTGVAMAIKEGSHISGDNWSFLGLPNRRFAMVLGDGMGVGEKAASESGTAINLLERLLLAGLSHQMAIEAVNSVLFLRSPEDSFTTLDMVVVNEVSATAEFIKICAPPTFVKRHNKVHTIKSQSLPVGIFHEVEGEYYQYNVHVDDLIINMTDGVYEALDSSEKDWCQVIEALDEDDPQKIADYIVELAKKISHGQIKDDLTVVVARIDYKSN